MFAHFLMPHYSYVYDPSCNLKQDVSTWHRRYITYSTTGAVNTPGSRRERYEAYFDQVRCAYELLAGFFDELKQAGIYDDATIIVHGDHGSRIGIYDPWLQNRPLLTEDDLLDSYRRYGFSLYGGAFSHSSQTQYSLAAMFNGQAFPDSDTATKPSPRATHTLDRNRWFDRLADQGYDVRVYRNDWLDFCPDDPPSLTSCDVSPANSVLLLRDADLPALQKAKLILFAFGTSTATQIRYPLSPEYWLGAIAMKESLSKMALDLRKNPRGTAVFAHFLMPHYSYVYDPSCNLKQDVSTWHRRYIT